MAAFSEQFPWPNYYGHFRFFESRLGGHDCVISLVSRENGLYQLTRRRGDTLKVFVCECYAFGVAEYLEAVENLKLVDAITINSEWCRYSSDVKRYGRDQRVGVFKIGDFMAALNRTDFWNFLNKDELKHFEEQGWI